VRTRTPPSCTSAGSRSPDGSVGGTRHGRLRVRRRMRCLAPGGGATRGACWVVDDATIGGSLMTLTMTRRRLIGGGSAIAIAPVALHAPAAAAAPATVRTGPLFVLTRPVRLFDSRTMPASVGGRL